MPPIRPDDKILWKKGKRRVAAKQPSPRQCVEWLAASNLHGVLIRGATWLACTRQLAYFLERVCLGRKTPARAATGVPVFSNALGNGDPAAPDEVPVVVRLSAEETFYLAHTLGCLTVHSVERGTPPGEEPPEEATGTGEEPWLMRLSLDELWTALLATNAGGAGGAHFIARCAAHVIQRREGWLPRSGLQYGADLVLYRNHPSLVHSDHCVVLRPGAELRAAAATATGTAAAIGDDEDDEPAGLRRWTEVQAVSRLCVQVNKGLVTATAECPPGTDASKPDCVRATTLRETAIARFNPERFVRDGGGGERP